MRLNELQKRFVFGIIAALVAAFAIYKGGSQFYLLILLAAAVASVEFDKMRRDGQICFIFCAIPVLIAQHPLVAFAMVGLAILLVVVQQFMAKKYYSWLLISIVYISIPAISILWLRKQEHGMDAVFWLAFVVVATDVGAYFFGKTFGQNLLAPTISPKKTWEGLAGGALCAAVVSGIISQQLIFVLLALIFSVITQAGDLLESAIKRNFNVKDTGTILPGHGGIMDRTDGFVLTAPLAALFYHAGIIAW